MALLAEVEIGNKIKETYKIYAINENEKRVAIEKFNHMKDIGALEGEFEDDVWVINNEANSLRINFKFNELIVCKQKYCSYKEFVDYVKYFTCFCFGDRTIVLYSRIVTNISNAVNQTECFTKMPIDTKCLCEEGVADFVSLIPWANEDMQMESVYKEYSSARTLAEYQSYFKFGDLIEDFWSSSTSEEREYFYPLYLWWRITMILPLRVTEFSVIPKDCLSYKNHRWYLTVRRTAIKGKNDVTKRYKIDTDYKKYTYEVTKEIADLIIGYKNVLTKYKSADLDTLFSDSAFGITRKNLFLNTRIYNVYPHLRVRHFSTIQEDFYRYYVMDKAHYKVLEKTEAERTDKDGCIINLGKDEIVKINLGDTRHIALQNLLINGCNYLMAKEVSGHDTIDMIYHYAGNLKNLVKCKAFSLYQQSKKTEKMELGTNTKAEDILLEKSLAYIETDIGRCYSKNFVEKNEVSDCYKVGGDCAVCCYFEGDKVKEQIKMREEEFEKRVARLLFWLNSKNETKNKEELAIFAEEMVTAEKNLEIVYFKEFEEAARNV